MQLIEFMQREYGKDLEGAVVMALRRVVGAYAIAVVDRDCPDKIVVARKSSPVVIGVGEDDKEFFIASDAVPIVAYTKQMVYLNDNEVALLRVGHKVEIRNLDNKEITHDVKEVDIDLESLEKGGFDHFMLKEIYDQPRCIADCMRGRLLLKEKRVVLSALSLHHDELTKAQRFIIVACGTSWHAGLIGKQAHRAVGQSACGSGIRLRVPLPQSGNPARRRGDSNISERRDGRHPGGLPGWQRTTTPCASAL